MKYLSILSILLLLIFITSGAIAQLTWTKHSNSVLSKGSAGDWDEKNVLMPSVLFDGIDYHLWYATHDFVTERSEYIGYATSMDGISWTKYDDLTTTNPPFN